MVVDHDRALPVADPGIHAPVHGVELEEMRVRGGIARAIVPQHDLVQASGGVERPQEELADTPKTVDRNARHRPNPDWRNPWDRSAGL